MKAASYTLRVAMKTPVPKESNMTTRRNQRSLTCFLTLLAVAATPAVAPAAFATSMPASALADAMETSRGDEPCERESSPLSRKHAPASCAAEPSQEAGAQATVPSNGARSEGSDDGGFAWGAAAVGAFVGAALVVLVAMGVGAAGRHVTVRPAR